MMENVKGVNSVRENNVKRLGEKRKKSRRNADFKTKRENLLK